MSRLMRRLALLLAGAMVSALFSGCVEEAPEPLWEKEVDTGERKRVASYTVGGVLYDSFSDGTADVACIDDNSFSGSVLTLADSVEGNPVVNVSDGAFRNLPQGVSITKVTLPAHLETIGEEAFRQTDIESVTLPDSLREIGYGAFSGCRKLVSVHFGAGLTSIPADAFSGCAALKEIALPEGIVSIGEDSFTLCGALERVTLPDSLREIGAYAFLGSGTEDLVFEIPRGVTVIGASAFRGTAWLKSLTDEFVVAGDGVLLKYNGTETDVLVPEDVKYLSDAFAGTAVTRVTLPFGAGECENAWAETPKIEIVRGE